ncbi:hypothetical protein SLS58_008977 [Diplodia intermedia]|uniref:NB-ARC domain-containing protein n=1 Tax=Diplodia intermedia TaxID=856260 RepID=A0ABR3TF47_9PEZI
MDSLHQAARPQSIFILVPGVETTPANEWNDEAGRPWLHSLPSSVSSDMSVYAFNHGLTARDFTWTRLLGQGHELLKQLVEASEEQARRASAVDEASRLPVVVIAHSIGGFILKEALCLAFEQKTQYMSLLKALAGIVFLGTPHSISRDDEVWGGIPYAIDQSSKAKSLINPDAQNNLAQLSSRFMQAAAELWVLSCYELEETSRLDEIFLKTNEDDEPALSSGKEMTMFALVGPGGMGKTQIATEFVHLKKDCFDAIFWVYADQPVKVANGFLRIALELGLIPEDSADAKDPVVVREIVKGWMANPVKSYEASENSSEMASWLLVFDNADHVDIIRDYWPVDGPGCVLLTSRDPLHLGGIEDSTLQPFSPEDAFNFLIKLTQRKDDPEEKQAGMEVSRRLGGLPLAVTQMAGIITRRDLSFAEFLTAYDERESQDDLFKTKMEYPLTCRNPGYGHTLASVWALESLKHGRALLDVLSFLDPDQIPESILTAFLSRKPDSNNPPLLHDYPRSNSEYRRARTELLRSSLISRQRTARSMTVHNLVQDVSRAKMPAPRLRLAFVTCLHLLSAKWPFEAFGWQHSVSRWSTCEELFPHVMKLMHLSEGLEGLDDDAETKFQLAKLLTGAGRFYHESGCSFEALPFFDKARRLGEHASYNLADGMLEVDNISSEDVEALLAEIHYNIGCVATETNNPGDAVLHFTTFNEMIASVASAKHKREWYAISWNELGVAQMMNKEWRKAERCFVRSIEIMKEVNASSKELQSFPTVNLGLSYWLQGGRLEEANAVLMAGLQDREAIYGINDRESFMSLLDQALKVFTGRPVYLAERARATFKKSRVLELRGLVEKASLEREASFGLLSNLTDLEGKTAADVSEPDFDEILCFWSR